MRGSCHLGAPPSPGGAPPSVPAATVAAVTGWQHTTRDYDPATDGNEEAWARTVAAEGWQTWTASGVWITLEGRRIRRWTLRRPCSRPWSVHDHAAQCPGTGATPSGVPGVVDH